MIGVGLQIVDVVRWTTVGSTKAEQAVTSQIYSGSSFKRVVELPVRDIPYVALADPKLLFRSGRMAGVRSAWAAVPVAQGQSRYDPNGLLVQKRREKNASTGRSPVLFPPPSPTGEAEEHPIDPSSSIRPHGSRGGIRPHG